MNKTRLTRMVAMALAVVVAAVSLNLSAAIGMAAEDPVTETVVSEETVEDLPEEIETESEISAEISEEAETTAETEPLVLEMVDAVTETEAEPLTETPDETATDTTDIEMLVPEVEEVSIDQEPETEEVETDAEEDAASGGNSLDGWTDQQIIAEADRLFGTPNSQGYIDWLVSLEQPDRNRVINLTGAGTQYYGEGPAARGLLRAASAEPVFRLTAVSADRYGDGTYAWTGSVNGTRPYYSYSLIGQTQGWSTSWLAMSRADGLAVSTLCIDPPAADPHYSGTFTAFNSDLDQRANHSDLFTEQALLIWWFSNTTEPGWQYRNALYDAVMPNLSAEQALIMEHILISCMYDPNGQWNYRTNFSVASLAPITDRLNAMAQQLHDTNSFTFVDEAGVSHTFHAPEHCYWTDEQGNQRITNQVQWFIPGAGGTGNGQRNLFATPYFYEVQDHSAWIKVVKSSGNVNVSNTNSSTYRLAGAVYGIYSDQACTDEITRVTTKADGTTDAAEIQLGAATTVTVYVKEISVPANYLVDPTVHSVTLDAGTHNSASASAVVNSIDQPVTGYLQVKKASTNTDISDGNRMYPLSGIQFNIYTAQSCAESTRARNSAGQTFTLTTDANGLTGLAEMPLGTYWVREVEASTGNWCWNPNPVRVTVTAGNTRNNPVQALVENEPASDPIGIVLTKRDAETLTGVSQGTATLAGAQFTVKYYDATSATGTPERTWVFETDENGMVWLDREYLVSGDELYMADGEAQIPVGTITIQETLEPDGYLLDDTIYIAHFTMQSNGRVAPDIPIVEHDNVADLSTQSLEQIIRGDVSFAKLDIDGNSMANIPFMIELLDEDGNVVESHVIVTDANGRLNTADRPKAGSNVNSLDSYVSNGVFTDESHLTGDTGVWFGEQSAQDDGKGSLIYGTYRITELRCSANEGQDLLSQEVTISENNKVVNLPATFIDLEIHPESDLLDTETGTKATRVAEAVSLTDTFRYDHLKTTKTYRLETEIIWVSEDGQTQESLGSNSLTFTPAAVDSTQTANGTIDNTITVSTIGRNGGTLNAVDRLYVVGDDDEEVLLVMHNEDLSDARQRVTIPYIGTTATDTVTGDHVGALATQASITDVVEYRNLAHGGMYLLEGTLRDAATGDVITGLDGQPCVVTKILRINSRATSVRDDGTSAVGPTSGEITVPEFRFDATGLAGHTLVVTEVLYDYDTSEVVIEHHDLSDEGQSIYYPDVRTTATENQTEDHIGPVGETVTLTDVVALTNLIVGKTYTVSGVLMDQSTGEAFLDDAGNEITAQSDAFEATETEMTIEMTFDVNSSRLVGTTLVVFEDLIHNDVTVGFHHEIDDEDQSIHFPEIGTTATANDTEEHVTGAHEETKITDVVAYSNLLTDGREYTVSGYLVDKANGNPIMIDGEQITAETTFVPEETSGEVEIVFTFDASALAGTTIVAFETVTYKGIDVAVHADINDAPQTVYIPEIRTQAHDADTGIDHTEAGQATLIDTVSYTNLLPGKEYTVSGYLVDKATGEPLMIGGNRIEAETTFTAEAEEGTVDVTFTFDASILAGQTIVVFETLYYDGIEIAVHADIEDKSQTNYIPEIGTTAIAQDTNDHITLADTEVMIVDTVEYSGLKPETKYVMTGTLMDQATGDAILVNGEKVTSSVTFVTGEAEEGKVSVSGSVDVTFTFDGSVLAGTNVVAFETLTQQEREVAIHADINDAPQTVNLPEICTTATDKRSGSHTMTLGISSVLLDTINYVGLIPDREYVIRGTVVDKASNESIGVTAEATFTPETADGQISLEFRIDTTSLHGHSLVVFERLYTIGATPEDAADDHEVLIALHEDIEDEGQTVHVPQRSERPKTGDSSQVDMAAAICICSAAAAGAALIARKRKKSSDEK